jgi:hypothetical protein
MQDFHGGLAAVVTSVAMCSPLHDVHTRRTEKTTDRAGLCGLRYDRKQPERCDHASKIGLSLSKARFIGRDSVADVITRLAQDRDGQGESRAKWLGCEDSNLGMAESKSAALPLGDTPTRPGREANGDVACTIVSRPGHRKAGVHVAGVHVRASPSEETMCTPKS